jgi:hypothetical protein
VGSGYSTLPVVWHRRVWCFRSQRTFLAERGQKGLKKGRMLDVKESEAVSPSRALLAVL